MSPLAALGLLGAGGALVYLALREKTANAAISPAVVPSNAQAASGGGQAVVSADNVLASFPFKSGVEYIVQVLADPKVDAKALTAFIRMAFTGSTADPRTAQAPTLMATGVKVVKGAVVAPANRWCFYAVWGGPSANTPSWSPDVNFETVATVSIPGDPPPPIWRPSPGDWEKAKPSQPAVLVDLGLPSTPMATPSTPAPPPAASNSNSAVNPLDMGMPPDLALQVRTTLMTESDPAKLRALAMTLAPYPQASFALNAKAQSIEFAQAAGLPIPAYQM